MKKILLLLVVVASVTLAIVGCSFFEKTYAYDASDSLGFCVEIKTSNRIAAEAAGYKEGTCPTEDLLGSCKGHTDFEGVKSDAFYYSTTGLDEAAAKAKCEDPNIGGTWKAK